MITPPGLDLGRLPNPEDWLSEEEARALKRFVDWSAAPGFRLAVVSFAAADRLRGVAPWIRTCAPTSMEVDAAGLTSKDVMQRLRGAGEGPSAPQGPLVLFGIEGCMGTKQLLRALNVARDDLAQHLPISWVIVLHAALRVDFEMLAPDFASYAGLWVGETGPSRVLQVSLSKELGSTIAWSVPDGQALGSPSELLNRAYFEVGAGSLNGAIDYLSQFDLTGGGGVPLAWRSFVLAAIRASGGKVEEARRILEQLVAEEQVADPVFLGRCHILLGGTYIALGDLRKAQWNHERAAGMLEAALRSDPPRADALLPRDLANARVVAIRGVLLRGDASESVHGGFLQERAPDVAVEQYSRRMPSADPERAASDGGSRSATREVDASSERLRELEQVLASMTQSATALKRQAEAKPERVDLQRDLAMSYERLGAMQLGLESTQEAFTLFGQSLEIRKRLSEAEPSRADLQRELSVSYNRLGELQVGLGNLKEALTLFTHGLELRKRLSEAEPSRADLQRDLSVSYNKLGELQVGLGNTQEALTLFTQSLEIAKRLSEAEPSRADFLTDLAVSFWKMSQVDPDGDAWLRKAQVIFRRLHDRGALHAAYVPFLEQLDAALGVANDACP